MRDATRADLSRPLRVDVEQDALTGGSRGLYGGAERAVAVAAHRPTRGIPPPHARHEGLTIEEVVVDAVAFAFSNGTCRGTHAEGDSRSAARAAWTKVALPVPLAPVTTKRAPSSGAVQD